MYRRPREILSNVFNNWAHSHIGRALVAYYQAIYAVHAMHSEQQKEVAGSIAAALTILEDQIRAGNTVAALEIADRGIRYFGSEPPSLDKRARALREFATNISKERPNKSPEPTPTAVTPHATEANSK